MNSQDSHEIITSSDLLNMNYWQTKFAALKLGAAIQSHQPRGAIQQLISQLIQNCDEILRDYPDHEVVKQWRYQAQEAQQKIGDNADIAIFRNNFAWDDYAFEVGWTHYHMTITAAFGGDPGAASHHAVQALTQLRQVQNRMQPWPENIRHWINSALLALPTFTLNRAA
jgi:hypothetical protein